MRVASPARSRFLPLTSGLRSISPGRHRPALRGAARPGRCPFSPRTSGHRSRSAVPPRRGLCGAVPQPRSWWPLPISVHQFRSAGRFRRAPASGRAALSPAGLPARPSPCSEPSRRRVRSPSSRRRSPGRGSGTGRWRAGSPPLVSSRPVPPPSYQRPAPVVKRPAPARGKAGPLGGAGGGVASQVPVSFGGPQPSLPVADYPPRNARARIGPRGTSAAGIAPVVVPLAAPQPSLPVVDFIPPPPRRAAAGPAGLPWGGVRALFPVITAYQRPPIPFKRPAPARAWTGHGGNASGNVVFVPVLGAPPPAAATVIGQRRTGRAWVGRSQVAGGIGSGAPTRAESGRLSAPAGAGAPPGTGACPARQPGFPCRRCRLPGRHIAGCCRGAAPVRVPEPAPGEGTGRGFRGIRRRHRRTCQPGHHRIPTATGPGPPPGASPRPVARHRRHGSAPAGTGQSRGAA